MNEKIFLCSICNINSGTCNEDCKFCSQSVRYKADIERYKQKPLDAILQEAKEARAHGALGFCLVTADKGITEKSLKFVCDVAQAVSKEVPELRLIACNGTATLEQLLILKESGIKAYNHNLETSKDFYSKICTTHPWQERYETCQNVNKAGLVLISGGIFGLGETQEDRVSMLESLRSLNPTSVPINFYHHNEALELEPNPLTTDEALELIKLTRETIPHAQRIMVAGGRELMFGERQNEIFAYGANSIVIGNYLTTNGRVMSKDLEMLKSLNLEVAKKV
ncbi:MAG: biotin synthase [Epsilonproteobacteria bacterium]|nr:biotin synthase [Campylobacterota bacterium]PIP09959.1 MAG: biotin synthase BioB [Sulfurimonas sp. CG23_combo_of_CG06-09_8_20_14_all_36_33]PIS26912.1 MAG: biotin synthase BioB [Sulfurimonas sp. CG08_land_8_20_14_0_20_36_33]PIU34727.1 MAG: biotin synthase BioB [Sulfurimonas sp. CG07_land_8_20_14_0_80_36_56]PIV03621.1 MAG: biotin synthase BioB [Sulfurimonas sp. CG03_land_8_20_14_0_80_36_25]PIV35848.1 MAG: biotin synthase BioB [Sulfurimonas sp. CG02_land_8_20_14_3_00_36_67]PIV60021.1 MAG: bio